MAENKSNKQKHVGWATDLLEKFEPLKSNADKFSNQLIRIFENGVTDYLNMIHERHIAAKNYFYPVLKDLSKSVLVQLELVKEEKQIKTYLEELLELEGLLFKHLQQFDKVSIIINNVLNNLEFKKQQVKSDHNQHERLEMVRQTIALTEKIAFEERKGEKATKKTKIKTKKEKADTVSPQKIKVSKPDTKELSFDLYKQGKTIGEIAVERGYAITTIENHLAHYVSLGLIPVTQFVSKEKFETIIHCSKKHEGLSSTPIKLDLGDDYSYSDIRFALATLKHLNKG